MDERETTLRERSRKRQTENPLLRSERRKKVPKSRAQKNAYKLLALKIILVILILLLVAALAGMYLAPAAQKASEASAGALRAAQETERALSLPAHS